MTRRSGQYEHAPQAKPGWCWRGHEVQPGHTSCPLCGAVLGAYSQPDAAPATVMAADGVTQLTGYKVEAVIYAPSQKIAEGTVRGTYVRAVFDRAVITGPVDEQPGEDDVLPDHPACSVCGVPRDNTAALGHSWRWNT